MAERSAGKRKVRFKVGQRVKTVDGREGDIAVVYGNTCEVLPLGLKRGFLYYHDELRPASRKLRGRRRGRCD